jgi:hypothetical protein
MRASRIRGLIAALLAGMLLFTLMPVASAAPPSSDLLTDIEVRGTLDDGSAFEGLLTITEFAVEDGQLLVSGVLEGVATAADGTITEVTQTFEDVAVSLFTGPRRCEILELDIGAIFLDLLGLQVDLSPIALDITAVRGPGRLLGNLLCAVAGLLDSGGLLDGLLSRINAILDSL